MKKSWHKLYHFQCCLRALLFPSSYNINDKDDDDDNEAGNGIVPKRILNLEAHVNCSAALI